jgi:hypothetical protein
MPRAGYLVADPVRRHSQLNSLEATAGDAELMRLAGRYAELFTLQASAYLD